MPPIVGKVTQDIGIFASFLTGFRMLAPAIVVGFIAVSAIPVAVNAQSSGTNDPTTRGVKLREELNSNKALLERSRARREALQNRIGSLEDELKKLNGSLVKAADKAKRGEAKLNQLEEELEKLAGQEKAQRAKLSVQNKSISRLLGAMQRIGRNPPPVIVTERSDALKMVRSAMLLARAFPRFREQASAFRDELNYLVKLLTATKARQADLKREVAAYRDTEIELASLKKQKREILGVRNKELDDVRKIAALATKKVASLSDLIASNDRLVRRRTRLGRYDKKLKAAGTKPTPQPLPKATIQPETKKVEPNAPKQSQRKVAALSPNAIGPAPIELAPRGGTLSTNPGRLEPAIPFHRALAKLPLPAAGKQVIQFGQQTSQGSKSKGLVIKTRHGAQITSPCDGWVVYAGSFRSYGQLLIINAGGGYHVLLANLSQLDVQLGQFVLAAEPVGSMAPRVSRRKKGSSPVLYVEFRKNGRPIDPRPWWSKGQRRMQG